MMPAGGGVAALAIVLALSALPATAAAQTVQEEIEEQLMCYCGCVNLTVRACTCSTADAMRREIADRLARGERRADIIAAFVERHGRQILSTPTRRGFNLLAWTIPFAVLAVAAAAVITLTRRWALRGAGAPSAAVGRSGPPDLSALDMRHRGVLDRVERELREGR